MNPISLKYIFWFLNSHMSALVSITSRSQTSSKTLSFPLKIQFNYSFMCHQASMGYGNYWHVNHIAGNHSLHILKHITYTKLTEVW